MPTRTKEPTTRVRTAAFIAIVKEYAVLKSATPDEIVRRAALYPELLEALESIQGWLLDTGPIVDDGIIHPAFVKANNLTVAVLGKCKGGAA